MWEQTVAALTSQTNGTFGRALTLDIPGCGAKRGRVTDALGIDDIAAELIGDIEAAGLRDVVLVGHSQAGTILPRLVRHLRTFWLVRSYFANYNVFRCR